jgi:succinate dehydrogenase hydrophobic anchor subunit
LVALLTPVFTEYAKLRTKVAKPVNFVAIAGVFFLLASGFEISMWASIQVYSAAFYGSLLFQFLGWLFLLIGVLWAAFGLLKE